MDVWESLQKNLKALRLEENLTQQQLSDKTGIPRANLCRYETGENVPPLDVLVLLAKFFGVSCDFLLGVGVD